MIMVWVGLGLGGAWVWVGLGFGWGLGWVGSWLGKEVRPADGARLPRRQVPRYLVDPRERRGPENGHYAAEVAGQFTPRHHCDQAVGRLFLDRESAVRTHHSDNRAHFDVEAGRLTKQLGCAPRLVPAV